MVGGARYRWDSVDSSLGTTGVLKRSRNLRLMPSTIEARISGTKDSEKQCSKGFTGGRLVYTRLTRKVKMEIPAQGR